MASGEGTDAPSAVILHLDADKRSPRQLHPETYISWRAMNNRCRDGRFEVDPRWRGKDGFANFLEDMGPRPRNSKYTIDRFDPDDRRYGPGLCRWVSKKAQTRNRRNTVHLTDADDTCRPLGEWADLKGVKPDTMRKRLGRGWSEVEVIHGRGRRNLGVAPESDADLVAALPYPVEGNDKKLMWERAYRNDVHEGERRLEFFLRMCRAIQAKLFDDWGYCPYDNDDVVEYLPVDSATYRGTIKPVARSDLQPVASRDPDTRTVEEYQQWTAAVGRGEAALSEELRSEDARRQAAMGKRRVARVLKAPDNLGRDAERRLDVLVFGYGADHGTDGANEDDLDEMTDEDAQ